MNNFTIVIIVIAFISMIVTSLLHLYLINMKISIVKIFLFILSLQVSFFPTFSVIFSFFLYSNCFLFLSLRVSPFSLLQSFICLLVSLLFSFLFIFYFLFFISYFSLSVCCFCFLWFFFSFNHSSLLYDITWFDMIYSIIWYCMW